MRKLAYTVLFSVIVLLFMSVLVSAEYECCIWKTNSNDDKCGYIDLTGSQIDGHSNKEVCENVANFFGVIDEESFLVTVYDGTCAEYTIGLDMCQEIEVVDIMSIPEFSTIAATLALTGAGAAYLYIRRKRK